MTPARHRQVVAPRAWRGIVGVLAAGITTVAVLGGIGVLPSSASQDRAVPVVPEATEALLELASTSGDLAAAGDVASVPAGGAEPGADLGAEEALPPDSGQGRRIVFSEGRQRVWLVSGRQRVKQTYLVSGSIYDNLDPGSYEVYSRSEQAWGIDGSGTMRYFVRFAEGERAAIGFHDIPVAGGVPVQTLDQLGTALSHGCIRQAPADAKAMWRFAPVGTTVVVTA